MKYLIDLFIDPCNGQRAIINHKSYDNQSQILWNLLSICYQSLRQPLQRTTCDNQSQILLNFLSIGLSILEAALATDNRNKTIILDNLSPIWTKSGCHLGVISVPVGHSGCPMAKGVEVSKFLVAFVFHIGTHLAVDFGSRFLYCTALKLCSKLSWLLSQSWLIQIACLCNVVYISYMFLWLP